jgi:hypothetical protein
MPPTTILPVPNNPIHMFRVSQLHFGIVKSVDDPEKRGRVLVECPGMFDEGADNWTTWAEYGGMPIGSNQQQGDMGTWWPAVPGLFVNVGFEGGNPSKPYAIPAGAWADGGKPYIPKEAQNAGVKGVHMRIFKSEAGHTLFFDDNGKQESSFLVDWTGAGSFSASSGTKEDEKNSGTCTASKMRQGERREAKTAMAQTSKKPSEVVEGGKGITGHLDLNGQGWICVAEDDKGKVHLFACKEKGKVGPSVSLDAGNNCIRLTAGKTQLTIDGKAGHVYTTSTIIWNRPFFDITKKIGEIVDAIKEKFKKYGESGDSSS